MRKMFKLFIFVFVMMLVMTGCGRVAKPNNIGTNPSAGTNNSSVNDKVPSTEELNKNVVASGAIAKNGRLVVIAANKNSIPVDMEIEVEFYDANGIIVGSGDQEFEAVGAKTEVAVEIYDTPETWHNYKIYVDVEPTDEISYFDKIAVTHSNINDQIAVQVTNNSNETIEYITVAVVYYQEGQIVGIEDGIESDVKPGRSANFNIDYAYDKNYDDVRFDSYKVFVTEAYSYNW